MALAYASYDVQDSTGAIWIGVISFLVALIASSSIKIADQWEKAVVLRLGCFHSLRGPGLFS
jgi:regulator of protease activity HflC (stomatin/prohibitin superfamily)